MKITEAMALAILNKKGRIYLISTPTIYLSVEQIRGEWGYEVPISKDVSNGYHRTKIAQHNCPDMPPIMLTLVESLK